MSPIMRAVNALAAAGNIVIATKYHLDLNLYFFLHLAAATYFLYILTEKDETI